MTRTVNDVAEIWIKDNGVNMGFNLTVIDEYDIGAPVSRWVVDNETTDANFDPTDTTKYSDYTTGTRATL